MFLQCPHLPLICRQFWPHKVSLEEFPLQFLDRVWEGLTLILPEMFGSFSETISSQEHFFVGRFVIIAPISLFIIGLINFSISLQFDICRLNVSRNLSISSWICWCMIFYNNLIISVFQWYQYNLSSFNCNLIFK